MHIKRGIDALATLIGNPSEGLPEDVFLFVSRVTPLLNVDLLIKDARGRTLLTWRDDWFAGAGWHIPGGIIRFKETISGRIRKVAKTELGSEVKFQPFPLAVNEIIDPLRKERGHFISLLYQCSFVTLPDESLRYRSGPPKRNQWMWHSVCPKDIIAVHEMYRQLI